MGVTSTEFCRKVEHLALKLLSLGVKKQDKIAILSENCPDWVIADFAIMSCGAITVPLHATLPSDQIQFILENSEAAGVFLSGMKHLKKIKETLQSLPGLRWSMVFKEDEPASGCLTMEKAIQEGGTLSRSLGEELEKRRISLEPGDVSSIIYTSGTTGVPKGVMLTHGNFLSNMEAVIGLFEFGSEDVGLSLLPLSHVLERLASYVYLCKGATLAFATSYETLQRDFMEVRPTVAVAVPRIIEVMQEKIHSKIHSSFFLKKILFRWGVRTGMRRGDLLLRKQRPPLPLAALHWTFRHLAFGRLHRSLGGRFRFFISGGAALSPDLGKFFFALGIPICEGYGLTETSPVLSVNTPGDLRFGTVGRVLHGVELKIAEDREILVKGPNVMKGYYQNEPATSEAFRDGWFHTGDTGELSDGFLVIGERKKDIIVTSAGKNIAPQRIENALKSSPLISNAVVFGHSRSYLSALIVPDFKKLESEAISMGVRMERPGRVIDDERLYDLFRKEVFRVTKPLANYEKVRKFALLGEEFTIDKGEMTPTLKVRRDIIFERYKDVIESMYDKKSSLDQIE